MPGFSSSMYENLISQRSETQQRLFAQYNGGSHHFDVVIVGSGMGGGILADDLADKFARADNGKRKRILVLEAGSYLFPTHVYNSFNFPNGEVARRYGVGIFHQCDRGPDDEHYIGELPQLNFGGRSIFWSGLIPNIQPWELGFFPSQVKNGISGRIADAQTKLNASESMGGTAKDIVQALRERLPHEERPLVDDFDIQETPRALHQPYLTSAGTPTDEWWIESTGVFNTAELLINQLGLIPEDKDRKLEPSRPESPLHVLLNHYVEYVERQTDGRYRVHAKDTVAAQSKEFTAEVVVLAAGSIESPKVIRRSPLFDTLPMAVKELVGRGLTDHPTTDWIRALVTNIGSVEIPKKSHAKIIFYSRGKTDNKGSIIYPFNVEMNVNHEYWHLRENDPTAPAVVIGEDESIIECKLSFGNFLDDENEIEFGTIPAQPYVPHIRSKNLRRVSDLAENRFKALAGWDKGVDEIWAVCNEVLDRILSRFQYHGRRPAHTSVTKDHPGVFGRDFGYGTVHHAVGTLRMPYKSRFDSRQFNEDFVVDEDLMVAGHQNLYVCDMSVMPYSSCENPVLTLAALALRLSDHLAPESSLADRQR